MDDLSTAISGFLSQPGAMEQLEAMAKQLGLSPSQPGDGSASGGAETGGFETADASGNSGTADGANGLGDLDGLSALNGLSGLGGLNGLLPEGMTPEKLGKLMQAVSQGNQPNQATAFLEALRPLLRNGKQEKLDRALRAVRLMHTAKAVTKSIEL